MRRRCNVVMKNRTYHWLLVLLFALSSALLAASCHEPTGTGEGHVRERWYHVQTGGADPRPVVVGGLVYFGTGDGYVVARDVATGEARWRTRVATQRLWGQNFVARAGVVAVPVMHYTVGLDATTGRELWRYAAPLDTVEADDQSAPGVVVVSRIDADDQTVYIPAWGASVSAVDLSTGSVRWVWEPGRAAGDTAVSGIFRSGSEGVRVSGDTVFATVWHSLDRAGLRSEPWLIALDRTSGRELWRLVLPAYTSGALLMGAPALYRNLVLFTSVGGYLWAVDRATGEIVWQFTPQPELATSTQPEVYGDMVYFDGGDRYLYALRASDGTLVWKTDATNSASRDLLVTEQYVYYPDGGTLFIFERETGRRVAALTQPRTIDSFFSSAPAAASGQIFVTVNGGAWSFNEP